MAFIPAHQSNGDSPVRISGTEIRSPPEAPLHVQGWMCGAIAVLGLVGPLTAANIATLEKSLARTLARYETPLIVIDMTRVHTVHASARLILESAARHARHSGGRVIIAGWPQEMKPLDGITMHPTIEQALTQLAKTRP